VSKDDYERAYDDLQASLNSLPSPMDTSMVDLAQAEELLQDSERLWSKATPDEKEQWFKAVFHLL
jgi:hypothetical protein